MLPSLRWHMQRKGHLIVPRPFVLGPEENREAGMPSHLSGFKLGAAVNSIRTHRDYTEGSPQRREELETMGFVWDVAARAHV